MHVHVADVDPAIRSFLSTVPVDSTTPTYASCVNSTGTLSCKKSTSPTPVQAKCSTVAKGSTPSKVAPFAAAYPTTTTGSNTPVGKITTLVHSLKDGVMCVLQATDRPVS